MLKRQRTASPTRETLSEALVLPAHHALSEQQEDPPRSKRSRIFAPVLDGRERGWNNDVLSAEASDIDAETEWSETDASVAAHMPWPPTSHRSHQMAFVPAWEYRRTNGMLHYLHIQNRLRKSEPPSFADPLPIEHPDHPQVPVTLPPPSQHHVTPAHTDHSCSPSQLVANVPSRDAMDQELVSVKERYEDSNKLLGSLFLRRRHDALSVSDAQQSRNS